MQIALVRASNPESTAFKEVRLFFDTGNPLTHIAKDLPDKLHLI